MDLDRCVENAKLQEDREVFLAYRQAVQSEKLADDSGSPLFKPICKIIELTHLPAIPSECAAYNKKILQQLRCALKTKEYAHLKHDEGNPLIHFLHALCRACFCAADLRKCFSVIGKAVSALTPDGTFAERLYNARELAFQNGLIKEDVSFRYFWKHFHIAWGTFLSMPFGKMLSRFFGFKKYDPKGDLANNAGVIFEEKIGDVLVTVIMTPTITVGDAISPEATALLQSIENDSCSSKGWIYVNLQNLNSMHEGPASVAIMQLQQKYPHSFRAITIASDSNFYRAGVHGHNEKKIAQALYDPAGLNVEYKERMKKELLDERNFCLQNRIGAADPGYYFPWKQEECEKQFSFIVDAAFDLLAAKTSSAKRFNWYQKAAFRELVNLGLIRYHQIKSVRDICKQSRNVLGGNVLGGNVLFTVACKESIDRGVKTNAELLWAQNGKNDDEVLALFYGRALLVRRRLILACRHEVMYALTSLVTQQELHNFLHKVSEHR